MPEKQKKNSISINKYKTKRELNIGTLIFALIFIYLVVAVVAYATEKRITVYEVREGSILKDHSYTGLILREETLVNAESDGYVNYYQSGQSKIRTGMNICAISPQKLDVSESQEQGETALSAEEQETIVLKAQDFNENFTSQKFSSVYSLKRDVAETLQNASDQTKTAQLDAVIAASGQDVKTYPAARDGVMVLTYDGEEGLTKDNFTDADFDKSNYKSTNLEDNMEIASGEPIYKLVTSEDWSVVIPLEDQTAKELSETDSVKVRLDNENDTVWADFSILKKGKQYYGCLDFDKSMIRYADERFVNIELILEDESGLKIPKTSVTEKDCYAVPIDYITSGGASQNEGVYRQTTKKGKTTTEFIPVTIINEDTESGIAYLDTENLKKGDTLLLPESSDTMDLLKTESIKGVYNVNKGYAVFKQVQILSESDEYYIIAEGNSYSLSNYDHIALNGDSVRDNQIVSQ